MQNNEPTNESTDKQNNEPASEQLEINEDMTQCPCPPPSMFDVRYRLSSIKGTIKQSNYDKVANSEEVIEVEFDIPNCMCGYFTSSFYLGGNKAQLYIRRYTSNDHNSKIQLVTNDDVQQYIK
jgi:hypothetical protein